MQNMHEFSSNQHLGLVLMSFQVKHVNLLELQKEAFHCKKFNHPVVVTFFH